MTKRNCYCWILMVLFLFFAQNMLAQNGTLDLISPPVAVDINPDPDIVEVILTAYPAEYDYGAGNKTKVWTYNGSIPGPTIETKLGDMVIIHFTNNLPEETTIHWHGMELPANMDGSNIAQNPVPPGGYFRYEFKLLRAAMFWYHPHIRTHEQVEKGLYGAFMVRDPEQDTALGLPEREHVLVFDDVELDESGQITEPFPSDPLENAAMQVNGKEGNTMLVNGRPAFEDSLENGVPHRFRILNASNTTFMRFSIKGFRMWRIGGDGGLLEAPIEAPEIRMVQDPHSGNMISDPDLTKGILLTPAERADVVFTPMSEGSIEVEWHDLRRGRHSASYMPDGSIGLGHGHGDGHAQPTTLVKLNLSGSPATTEYMPPAQLRDIVPIESAGAGTIPVLFGHSNPDSMGNVTFFAQMKDGKPLPFAKVTPDDAPTVEVGETRIWEVNNLTGGMHNFHTHGFHFQWLETQYVDMDSAENNFTITAPFLEDKDTIVLPTRPGAKGRSRTITRVVTKFSDAGREGTIEAYGKQPTTDRSGGWLFHCHILEHAARGMMSFFQVREDVTSVTDNNLEIPSDFLLYQNYPNPFNPETEIRFEIPTSSNVGIVIYNVLGQKIRTLVDNAYEPGFHFVNWDAKDDRGVLVSSGVYFYQLRVGDFSEVKRMTLTR